ncbi:cytochrome P450 [Roseibacterium beibuensis]|uniref:cytochrome P450 n=1 Tax=[Roseibacterium] beibuensis TaxID=1193142 RepID=UPI00217E6CB0|nr:cytochrome P450 [Roseibacterium beibuensis]MCS6622569.1 cytochrome P450 [Roseibacterium beibuensis]
MDGEPPKLEFRGRFPLALPGAGRVLRDPEASWPPEILEQSVVEARAAGRRRLVLLASPEAINEVLTNQDGAFPRARLHDRMLGASYGDNLVRGDRADWRWQRRQLLQPFNAPGAERPEARIALACERIVDEWAAAPEGAPIDVIRDARRFTLDSLWRSFFCDEAAAGSVEPLVEATALAMDAHETAPLVAHLDDLRPLAEVALAREGARLDAEGGGGAAVDFNTMLLFLHAGHDNVAAALAWALWLLVEHPDWQARLREEWRARPTADAFDAGAFPVAGAVISETLRLYPPIMHLIREVKRDLDVGGETVPGGFTTVLSLYALHRNRQWWDAPDAFRPERFLDAAPDIRRRLLWAPFGTGPRGCVGSAFARTEMIVALGTILDRLELMSGPGGMACRVDFVLRPEGREAVTVRPVAG